MNAVPLSFLIMSVVIRQNFRKLNPLLKNSAYPPDILS